MATDMIDNITKVLMQSAKVVEDQVDAELTKLNEMDEDDFEKMRERRLEALKKAQKQKQVCLFIEQSTFSPLLVFYSLHLVN